MEIIIKSTWDEETREEKIDEYISSIGENIFQKCKISRAISNEDFSLISLDTCINYAKNKISPYIYNITSGSFSIIISDQTVVDVLKLAKLEHPLITI